MGRRRSRSGPSYNELIEKVGRTGQAIGRAGEERALKAFLHINQKALPSWWKGIRKATPREDAREIDCVVTTDVGDIAIQVKTSLSKSKDDYPERTKRFNIPIIYINLQDSDAEIRKRIVAVVGKERSSRG